MRELLVSALLMAAMTSAAFAGELTREQLLEENARLKAMVEQMAEQLEGTAKPTNLARTSLAMVSASSVNGQRPFDNSFHGVCNAFDNGQNWLNGVNYSSWLSGGERDPWIEIRFDVPVTVAEIQADGAPPFSARIRFDQAGEQFTPEVDGQAKLNPPLAGVRSVQLHFSVRIDDKRDRGSIAVQEVRVLGFLPGDAKFEVTTPRIGVTRDAVLPFAEAEFTRWNRGLLNEVKPKVTETETSFVVVYSQGDLEVFRATVSKANGEATGEPLVELRPKDNARVK